MMFGITDILGCCGLLFLDAYPRGDIWRKARAVLWILQALERELKTTDFQLAELQLRRLDHGGNFFALRHTAIVLKPTTSDVARYVSQKTEINSAP